MKTFSIKTAQVPQLDTFELSTLADTIQSFIETYEKRRVDRIRKIEQCRKSHLDDFGWRAKKDTIFHSSNMSVPIMKGIASSLAAKFEDEIWNADIPFLIRPEMPADKAEAERWQKYWEWELLREICVVEVESAIIDTMCVEGTAISKRWWEIKRSYFSKMEDHIHDMEGNPLQFPDGSPMTSETKFEPHPKTMMGVTYGTDFHPVHPKTGELGAPLPSQHQLKPVEVPDYVEHYNNAKLTLIPFEDFCADMMCNTLDESALVAHFFEEQLWETAEKIRLSLNGGSSGQWVLENLSEMANATGESSAERSDYVREKNGTTVVTGQKVPYTTLGEVGVALQRTLKERKEYRTSKLGECYIKYDINKDGIPEDIIVLFERDLKKVLWYDYHVNQYADCKRPFVAHGLYRVPNRWWSIGPYEYLKLSHEYMDAVFNRMNFRTAMNANPVSWIKPDNWIRKSEQWGPGQTWELKMDKQAADSFGFMVMPSLESIEWQFFQFFISVIQLVTGITSAAQGDVSNLPSNNTATGISSIIEEGNKLFRKLIGREKRAVREDVFGLVRLIQQNLDLDRVYRYTHADKEIYEKVTPEEIRQMDFDVDIVITRFSGKLKMDAMTVSLQVVQSFMALPPQYQIRLRSVFVTLLQSSGITEADEILPSMEEINQDQQKDGAIQAVKAKVEEIAARIASQNIDPSKQAAQDLLGVSAMMAQLINLPPTDNNPGGNGAAPQQPGQPAQSPTAPTPLDTVRQTQ